MLGDDATNYVQLLSTAESRSPHLNVRRKDHSMNRIVKRLREDRAAGFTLIELLIVIVILGILAGIAIFAVSQFQDNAKTACNNANSRINATVSVANTITGGSYTTAGGGSC